METWKMVLGVTIFTILLGSLGTAYHSIDNCYELQNIDTNGEYRLEEDFSCEYINNFNPIGSENDPFRGTFLGQEHTIRNLNINHTQTSNIGLFGVIGQSGEVKNLEIKNAEVIGESSVGILAGNSWGTVENIRTDGEVKANLENQIWSGNCGGLLGENTYGTVKKSYSNANVECEDYVGGLIGSNHGSEGGKVINSYAHGDVTATYGWAAGLLGSNSGYVENSYSTGHVESPAESEEGGFVGKSLGGFCKANFWDVNTSDQSISACATGKTTEQMQTKSTFTNAGWNFQNTWYMENYPSLRFQHNEPPEKPILPEPEDDEKIPYQDKSLTLSTIVQDPNQDNLTAEFYINGGHACTDTDVPSGSRAECNIESVAGETYHWYVEVTDGDYSAESNSWFFEVNNPPYPPYSLTPDSGAELSERTSQTLSAEVIDMDAERMDVKFHVNNEVKCTKKSVPPGSNVTCDISVEPGEDYEWYVEADDGYNASRSKENKFKVNTAPDIPENPYPTDQADDVSANAPLKVDVNDEDKDTVKTSFYLKEEGSSSYTEVGYDEVIGSGRAKTNPLSLSNSTTYKWYVESTDGEDTISTEDNPWTFTTEQDTEENHAPVVELQEPVNQAKNVNLNPSLKAYVEDPNGDTMNVTFINAEDNTTLSTEINIDTGSTLTHQWSNLSYDTTYKWYVEATDGDKTTETDTWSFTTIEEGNQPPTASFTVSDNEVEPGETITFNASDSYDPDGNITNYTWTFGNGENATGKTVTHSYSNEGTYTAKLTVKDNENATDTANKTITIEEDEEDEDDGGNGGGGGGGTTEYPPTAYAGPNKEVTAEEEVEFQGTGSDTDGEIVRYRWDFDGDGEWDYTSTETGITTAIYTEEGTYTAKLEVKDEDGLTDVDTATVTVKPQEEKINESFSQSIDIGSLENMKLTANYFYGYELNETTVTINIENRVGEEGLFRIRMEIPKKIAETTEDLEIDPESDTVILKDPVVAWNTSLAPLETFQIQLNKEGYIPPSYYEDIAIEVDQIQREETEEPPTPTTMTGLFGAGLMTPTAGLITLIALIAIALVVRKREEIKTRLRENLKENK